MNTLPALQDIFLDRDGVVIQDKHYLSEPGQVRLTPGAGPALGRLRRAGARLFLVTNQSGVGRGYFSESDYQACQQRLRELLRPYGAVLADVAHCPHAPGDKNCSCRKPATGMWEQLKAVHDLDPSKCAMVGDKPSDILFARNAGFAVAALVCTGKGERTAREQGLAPLQGDCRRLIPAQPAQPDLLAKNLAAAADWLRLCVEVRA